MKEQIDAEGIRSFKRDQKIFLIMLTGMVVLPMPLVHQFVLSFPEHLL